MPFARTQTACSGTLTAANNSVNFTGTGTAFYRDVSVGSTIVCEGQTRTVATITSNSAGTVTVAWTPAITAKAFTCDARIVHTGSYQSQVSTAVDTAVDISTGYIDAATNWSTVVAGQAFAIIRAGAVIAVRCLQSATTTRLTYYRLYTDDGVEITTDVQVGDTITLYEDAVTVASGTALGSITGVTLTTNGAGALVFRNYQLPVMALDVAGFLQFRHTDIIALGSVSPEKTIRVQAGGRSCLGSYSTIKGITRFDRDILIRGSRQNSSNSNATGGFYVTDTSTSRTDWFGGTIEGGGAFVEAVSTASINIYSKAATFRGLGTTNSQLMQYRPTGVVTVYGVTIENGETFMVTVPVKFEGFSEKHCRLGVAISASAPASTWVPLKGANITGGNTQSDLGLYGGRWFRFINHATGSAFVFTGNTPSGADVFNNGFSEIRQEVTASLVNVAGAGVDGRIFCRDVDNGVRKNGGTYWAGSPDWTTDRTYDAAITAGAATINTDGGILLAVYMQLPGSNTYLDQLYADWRGVDNSSTDRFLFGFAAYGYNPAANTYTLKGTLGSSVPYTVLADSGVTASAVTAATYTDRFTIDASGNVTVTADATLDQLYDYAAYWLTLSGSNMEAAGLGSKLIDFAGPAIDLHKTVTINSGATLSSGAKFNSITTTDTLTITGSMDVASYTSTAGTFVAISIAGITAGSRIQIYNVTDAVEIENSVVAGTTYSEYVEYTADKSIRLRATWVSGVTAKQGYETTATLTVNGLAFTANQLDCAVYNGYGIDGATVTGFTSDYTDDEVDLTVGANFYLTHLFAWWCYNLTTAQGISDFFGGITPIDEGNLQVNDDIVSIFLDNTTTVGIWALDNRRFFRADGARPVKSPTTGGGGIDVEWREKVLFVNSPDIAAIKAKTDNLPSDPADQSILAASIAAIPTTPLLAASYVSPLDATATQAAAAAALTAYDAATGADVAAIPAAPSAAANATAVRSELAAELANIGADTAGTTTLLGRITGPALLADDYTAPLDATDTQAAAAAAIAAAGLATALAVSAIPTTPLLAGNYVAPDNTKIGQIKTKVDTLVNTDLSGIATSLEIAALNDFNPAVDVVARVTLVDTTTANSDMRGTDGAITSLDGIATSDNVTAVPAALRVELAAELAKANALPADTAAELTALSRKSTAILGNLD